MSVSITDMGTTSPLGDYILDLCERQNLSMREASIRSDLSPETIGVIVRRGTTTKPRPETLRQIAGALNGSFQYMMQLAGHLERKENLNTIDPALQSIADQLIEIWYEVRDLDPEAAARLTQIAVLQSELVLASMRSSEKSKEKCEQGENITAENTAPHRDNEQRR